MEMEPPLLVPPPPPLAPPVPAAEAGGKPLVGIDIPLMGSKFLITLILPC